MCHGVQIDGLLGLTSLPQPGDPFQTVADAAKARQIATFRQTQAKDRALGAKGGRLTLESLKEQIAELTRYIEPIMIIVMGVIIGGVALALLLPIFTISRVVAH